MMEQSHGQGRAGRRNGAEMKQREVWNGHGGADLFLLQLQSGGRCLH